MRETPQYNFRGNFVKAEIFHLVDARVITIKEAWCLLIIDNIAHVYRKDVFVSVSFLASKLQVKERRVQQILQKLKRMGLIVQTRFDGRRRFMRVEWEVSHRILNSNVAVPEAIPEQQDSEIPNRGAKNCTPAVQKIAWRNNRVISNRVKLHSSNQRSEENDPMMNACQEFLNATSLKRTRPPSIKTWSTQLRRFIKHEEIEESRVLKVLKWYAEQFDKDVHPYHRKYLPPFVPQANSMAGFVTKFFNIEIAMLRECHEEGETAASTIEMSPEEKIAYDKMKANLSSAQSAKLATLPSLVRKLCEKRKQCVDHIAEAKLAKTERELYLNGVLTPRVFFVSYSMWIETQVKAWEGWQGDFKIFAPGEKHFTRFMNETLKRNEIGQNSILRKIL